jgi:protein involved in ribonucleotide reduction
VLSILIAKEPVFAHLRIVETYAAGPEAIKRMEEVTAQFAPFLGAQEATAVIEGIVARRGV